MKRLMLVRGLMLGLTVCFAAWLGVSQKCFGQGTMDAPWRGIYCTPGEVASDIEALRGNQEGKNTINEKEAAVDGSRLATCMGVTSSMFEGTIVNYSTGTLEIRAIADDKVEGRIVNTRTGDVGAFGSSIAGLWQAGPPDGGFPLDPYEEYYFIGSYENKSYLDNIGLTADVDGVSLYAVLTTSTYTYTAAPAPLTTTTLMVGGTTYRCNNAYLAYNERALSENATLGFTFDMLDWDTRLRNGKVISNKVSDTDWNTLYTPTYGPAAAGQNTVTLLSTNTVTRTSQQDASITRTGTKNYITLLISCSANQPVTSGTVTFTAKTNMQAPNGGFSWSGGSPMLPLGTPVTKDGVSSVTATVTPGSNGTVSVSCTYAFDVLPSGTRDNATGRVITQSPRESVSSTYLVYLSGEPEEPNLTLEIKSLKGSNDPSFTTEENVIHCTAEIQATSESVRQQYNSKIRWKYALDSGLTSSTQWGAWKDTSVTGHDVQIPVSGFSDSSSGRISPLRAQFKAYIPSEKDKSKYIAPPTTSTLTQDAKDQLRQRYIDMGAGTPPSRAGFLDETDYTNTLNARNYTGRRLAFHGSSGVACQGNSGCPNARCSKTTHGIYVPDSVIVLLSKYDAIQTRYTTGTISVSSVYRCPMHTICQGSPSPSSQHTQGKAFDFNGSDAEKFAIGGHAKAETVVETLFYYPASKNADGTKYYDPNGKYEKSVSFDTVRANGETYKNYVWKRHAHITTH